MENKSLSDKMLAHSKFNDGEEYIDKYLLEADDVKEFIKKLKEEIKHWEYQQEAFDELMKIIDKLAGKKLI